MIEAETETAMNDAVMNDVRLVRLVLADLRANGFRPLLIGGWAEEILGLVESRPHEDVDVLLLDPTIESLDAFVATRGEVVDGHLSHKRVCLHQGVKIELFIAARAGGSFETVFWDRLTWQWPGPMQPVDVDGLPLAPVEALRGFRSSFAEFMAARDAAVNDRHNPRGR
jgi:hypothetical protein